MSDDKFRGSDYGMHMANTKTYSLISGLRGNEGEDPATLAVAAVIDASPNYPDCARIIAGSSRNSESDIGGFSCGPVGAVKVAAVLIDAAMDVEEALGRPVDPLKRARLALADWLLSDSSRPPE